MQAKTEENTVATLEEERERLAEQAGAARRSVRDAEQRLQEIDERSAAIASKSFVGDEEAAQEIEDLEEETVRVTRSLKVARAAAEDFQRMLAENAQRLAKTREDVLREEAAELYRQSAALDSERDEAAARLSEILEEQDRLYSERQQVVNRYDQNESNRMASAGGATAATRGWLESAFGRWLLG